MIFFPSISLNVCSTLPPLSGKSLGKRKRSQRQFSDSGLGWPGNGNYNHKKENWEKSRFEVYDGGKLT